MFISFLTNHHSSVVKCTYNLYIMFKTNKLKIIIAIKINTKYNYIKVDEIKYI